MDITEILLIIFINITVFLSGILAGRLHRKRKETGVHKEVSSLKKDADWHLLMNYYPDEPTDILSSHRLARVSINTKEK